MASNQDETLEIAARLDRPSASVPSIDRPWEHPVERESRREMTARDRAQHRAFHSLYEDMLN